MKKCCKTFKKDYRITNNGQRKAEKFKKCPSIDLKNYASCPKPESDFAC
jgi:hypothetical protein